MREIEEEGKDLPGVQARPVGLLRYIIGQHRERSVEVRK
jgi:hypothetical protein